MKNSIILIIISVLIIMIRVVSAGKWSELEMVEYKIIEPKHRECWADVSQRDPWGNIPIRCSPADVWARITVKNPKGVDLIIEDRYFIATLADNEGTKVEGSGLPSSIRIGPGEVRTVTIYFGRQSWPIMNIETK